MMEESKEVTDLIDLIAPHEGNITEAVFGAVKKGRDVMLCGRATLFLNPNSFSETYHPRNVNATTDTPNLWDIAKRARSEAMSTSFSQCILPFGVSGSGQTETAKILTRYLLYSSSERLGKTVGCVNMLLDCFTCAVSDTSTNSSKAHRVYEVAYGKHSGLVEGVTAKCFNLDLECIGLQGGVAYHAFNLLATGSNPEIYSLPAQDDPPSGSMFTTKDDFLAVQSALETIGVSELDRHTIWSVLASIFHIQRGNMELASTCLSLPLSVFTGLDVPRAVFCKLLYSALFSKILAWCNKGIQEAIPFTNTSGTVSVHVADFGGAFATNGASRKHQLYLNTVHEVLRRTFATEMLDRPYEMCLREGISLSRPQYEGNTSVVAMLTGSNGVLDGMSKAAKRGAGVAGVREEIRKRCFGNPFYSVDDQEGRIARLMHSQDSVAYSLTEEECLALAGLDMVPSALEVLHTSTDDVVKSLTGDLSYFGTHEEFLSALDSVGSLLAASTTHWVCCIPTTTPEVTSRSLFGTYIMPLTILQKHGYPVSFTHFQFLAKYRPLLSELDKPQGPSQDLSVARSRVFSPTGSPVRPHYGTGDMGLCSRILDAAQVGGTYDSKVTFSKVFLMYHSYKALEAALDVILDQHAELVQAFSRCVPAMDVLKERVLNAHAPQVLELRESVRKVLQLEQVRGVVEKEEELAGRSQIEEEADLMLVEVANDFVEEFLAARVAECEGQEGLYREALEEEEEEVREELYWLLLDHVEVQLHTEEVQQRAETISEEHEAFAEIMHERLVSFTEARLAEEEVAEEEERAMLQIEEDNFREQVAWVRAEEAKEYIIEEEPIERDAVEKEQKNTWADLVEEMQFAYTEIATEELLLDEEIERYGYRGVGGIMQEEAAAWQFITAQRVPVEVTYFTQQLSTRHSYNETAARDNVRRQEYDSRARLASLLRISLLPIEVAKCYKASLALRDVLESDEAIDRAAVVYAALTSRKDMLVLGRGHESEPGHRRIIEKLQRNGVRRLVAMKRQFYNVLNEQQCRQVMENLEGIQRDEIHSRLLLQKNFTTTIARCIVKFEVGKKRLCDVYRARVYSMVEADARNEEHVRRHYETLRASRGRADHIFATLGSAACV
eukprot:TRINITY_DN8544_c0_g1_i1.p1 TRINITY_DN8544_c0_g1~~TRINITY_DN8544_c0_g1_i1.p1  ORF type:complete len:1187 (+),score=242.49 TRINITY_DN8544_c0_g1_i1:193-3561(+)